MTRINTNVSSFVAQRTLARTNAQLQTSLARLSTGLRINTGKDDPAGLIASEALRSEIISVEKAITNSERANQLIATADSALGQVSSLLNDIRGLVSEAANTGALNSDQLAANQLQIDSSLEAIDRIAQITSFQGQKLLDGSLDFITQNVVAASIEGLKIDQANFGTQTSIGVKVNVVAQATLGALHYNFGAVSEAVTLEISGSNGAEAFSFAANSTIEEIANAVNLVADATGVRADVAQQATAGEITVSSLGLDNDIVLTANEAGFDPGNLRVQFTAGDSTATTANYTAASGAGDPGVIDISLRTVEGVAATGEIEDDGNFTKAALTIDQAGANNGITFTAVQSGAAGNDVRVEFVNSGSEAVSYNAATKTVRVDVNGGTTTANDVIDLVNQDAVVSQFVTSALTAEDPAASPNTGAGTVTVEAAQNLTGGRGDANNDLKITSRFTGETFNGADVHIVSGNATAAGIASINRASSFSFAGSVGTGAVTLTSKINGESGNNVEVIVDQAAIGNAANIAVAGSTITLTIDSGGATTAATIATAFQNDVSAGALVSATADAAGTVDGYLNSGENLNNGQHAAAATAAVGGNSFNFRAKAAGLAGNEIQVDFTEAPLGGGNESIAVDGNTITINLDSDGGGTTLQDVVNLIQGNDAANSLIDVSVVGSAAAAYTGAAPQSVALSGVGQAEYVEYAAQAKAASASVTFDGAAGASADNDFTITARLAGTAFNNISVVLNTSAAVTNANPTATFDQQNQVVNITIASTGTTTIDAIRSAVEGIQLDGEQVFDTAVDISAGEDGTGVIDADNLGTISAGDEIGNTANTGGEANTLFVYVEENTTIAQNVIDQVNNAEGDGRGQNNTTRRVAELFDFSAADDNDGTGKLFELTVTDALAEGVTGGTIAADAEEVINVINTTAGLSDDISASLAEDNDGKIFPVQTFQEFAISGTAAGNNGLQFLGDLNSADIRFVADVADQVLSIEDNRGFGNLVKDSEAGNSALVFTAKQRGSEFDGIRVAFVDDNSITKGNETVSYDANNKVLRFNIATGNAIGENSTADDVRNALAADDYASQLFDVSNFGSSDGTGAVDADLRQSFADLEFDSGADIVRVSRNAYGADGNDLTVNLVDAGAGGATSISFANDVLTITIDQAAGANSVTDLAAAVNSVVGGEFTAEVVSNTSTASDLNNPDATFPLSFSGGLGVDADGDAVPDASGADDLTAGGRGDALIVNLATDANGLVTTTANDLVAFFDDPANALLVNDFGASVSHLKDSDGTARLEATTDDIEFASEGILLVDQQASGTSVAVNGKNARVKITANQQGEAFDNVSVVFANDDSITGGNETATYDATTKTLTVSIDQGLTTAQNVIDAINASVGDLFTAEVGGDNGGQFVTTSDTLTLTGGVVENGAAQGAAFLSNADQASTGLSFVATRFGSDAFVQVKSLTGTFELVDNEDNVSERSSGTDVDLRLNGIQAIGRGLRASLNTASLDLSFSLNEAVLDGEEFEFQITGGGANFQLGPDVVSNQQARLGIQSVSTATLGGVNGRLFELRSGGAAALTSNVGRAANIVSEVITNVTQLRGRLGAFQKTTLETNIFTLNDTLANLVDAESSIRDADFAAESAQLTRAQILVQSGTSVLAIANQNPQNVLALLR